MICNHDCESCNLSNKEKTPFEKIKQNYAAIDSFSYNFEEYSMPTAALLGVTNNCNLACPYCFVHQNPENMTLETAEKAVEWLIHNYNAKTTHEQRLFVGFFGGEPLLRYDEIIVPIVKKYKDTPDIDFGITTNGTLLDEDKVDFFKKNNVSILLSFDGVEIVQNKQRPGKNLNSFEKTLNNIPYLLLRFPNTVMRATVTKESIPYIYESTIMASELGFKYITFCPNSFEDWTEDDRTLLYEQFNQVGHYIYKELMQGNMPIHVSPLTSYFSKLYALFNSELKFENRLLRCGLGTNSCAITPNGDIVPCQEKTSHPTIILGNVDTGINAEIHEQYLQNVFNEINAISCEKNCSCKTKMICLSDLCPSRLEDLNYTISTSGCAFTRAAAAVAIRLFFLCHHSPLPIVSQYFDKEGNK